MVSVSGEGYSTEGCSWLMVERTAAEAPLLDDLLRLRQPAMMPSSVRRILPYGDRRSDRDRPPGARSQGRDHPEAIEWRCPARGRCP
jgi:hypothetical protein